MQILQFRLMYLLNENSITVAIRLASIRTSIVLHAYVLGWINYSTRKIPKMTPRIRKSYAFMQFFHSLQIDPHYYVSLFRTHKTRQILLTVALP